MDNANGTWLLTASLIGMTIGALTMGWLTDKLGRRKLLIGAVVAFSVLTFVTGFATEAWHIGVLRFFAGLGLGGCLPTAISMVTGFAGRGRGSTGTPGAVPLTASGAAPSSCGPCRPRGPGPGAGRGP